MSDGKHKSNENSLPTSGCRIIGKNMITDNGNFNLVFTTKRPFFNVCTVYL